MTAPPEEVAGPWAELGTPLLVAEPGVRAWVEVVPPGEERPAHTHRHPWVTVVVSGAAGESYGADGELIGTNTLTTGQVVWNGADKLPFTHHVRNTSDRTLVMVAVELRPPSTD